MKKIVLGIETSCDDTSVAILEGTTSKPIVHFFKTFGQEEILKHWGGVVPEIASRNHLEKITPLIEEAFRTTKIKPSDLSCIGVTLEPGLLGPLLTGMNAAKTLSLLYKTPIVPVNHLYAHLEAIHIDQDVSYPYLGLLVSGGHTLFALVRSHDSVEIIGSTIDDAAGEAFDKGGKLLGLGYPAGKIIDDLSKLGDRTKYEFPIGLKSSKSPSMSFSGIKTSLRVHLEKNNDGSEKFKNDTIASYQEGIINNLVFKLKYAERKLKEEYSLKNLPIVVGGGVASNSRLRELLGKASFVTPKYCTDNGAMIAHYALLSLDNAIPYPNSLYLDARNRTIDKKEFLI